MEDLRFIFCNETLTFFFFSFYKYGGSDRKKDWETERQRDRKRGLPSAVSFSKRSLRSKLCQDKGGRQELNSPLSCGWQKPNDLSYLSLMSPGTNTIRRLESKWAVDLNPGTAWATELPQVAFWQPHYIFLKKKTLPGCLSEL